MTHNPNDETRCYQATAQARNALTCRRVLIVSIGYMTTVSAIPAAAPATACAMNVCVAVDESWSPSLLTSCLMELKREASSSYLGHDRPSRACACWSSTGLHLQL